MHLQTLLRPVLLLVVLTGHAMGARGFTEPDITVYGKVFNQVASPALQSYSGIIEWTFQSGTESLVVTTELEVIAGGDFSYRLEVPVQKVPASFLRSENTVEATASPTDYTMSVTIDGAPASLTNADGSPRSDGLTFAELFRGTFERIDLAYTGEIQDSDNDSIPDFWEQRYATILDPNNPLDGFNDDDGDGIVNLAEYLDGTDPTCHEWTKWLALHQLATAGPTLNAADADPDEDGLKNSLEYALGGDPRSPDAASVLAHSSVAIETDTDGKNYLTMTVDRPPFRSCHVDYVVEVSSDLLDWESTEGTDIVTLATEVAMMKVRDGVDAQAAPQSQRFMRLRVTHRP